MMYSSSGIRMSEARPGTKAAVAQPVQVMVWPMAASARLADSGLAAMAVRNMAEEMHDVWKHVTMRYEPTLRAVPSSGFEPQAVESDCTSGSMIPPARAASEGIAGESSASAKTSE